MPPRIPFDVIVIVVVRRRRNSIIVCNNMSCIIIIDMDCPSRSHCSDNVSVVSPAPPSREDDGSAAAIIVVETSIADDDTNKAVASSEDTSDTAAAASSSGSNSNPRLNSSPSLSSINNITPWKCKSRNRCADNSNRTVARLRPVSTTSAASSFSEIFALLLPSNDFDVGVPNSRSIPSTEEEEINCCCCCCPRRLRNCNAFSADSTMLSLV